MHFGVNMVEWIQFQCESKFHERWCIIMNLINLKLVYDLFVY